MAESDVVYAMRIKNMLIIMIEGGAGRTGEKWENWYIKLLSDIKTVHAPDFANLYRKMSKEGNDGHLKMVTHEFIAVARAAIATGEKYQAVEDASNERDVIMSCLRIKPVLEEIGEEIYKLAKLFTPGA